MLFHQPSAFPRSQERRPAIILLVVIALLTIFAAAAVAFVFYADSEATSSKYYREATINYQPDVDPEMMFSFVLQQLIFGVKDDESGVYSAMRGHDLFRNTYGMNYTIGAGGVLLLGNNAVPFNGTGRLHYPYNTLLTPQILKNQSDASLINYTYYFLDGFIRDPERYGYRANGVPLSKPFVPRPGVVSDWNDTATPRGQYFRSANPSYTYPDLNNMFLAAVKTDGTVLMPSFHRHWLFNPKTTLNDATNPNWTSPTGKYWILRPRPNENPGFPYPESPGGDVQNLVGGPGYFDPRTQQYYPHDSIWMYLGSPVFKTPDGRKYTCCFATLITDLDGKINVNVAGNVRGAPGTMNWNAGNQGFGPWEMSLQEVLNADFLPGTPPTIPPTPATEWAQLFLGVQMPTAPATAPPRGMGRYGADKLPTFAVGANVAPPGTASHFYAKTDTDGVTTAGTPSLPIPMPKGANCFPNFNALPNPGYGYDDGSLTERTNHALLYNLTNPAWLVAGNFDHRFAPSNMEMMLRFGGTGTEALTSELAQLCPKNFVNPPPTAPRTAAAYRGSVTTDSWDTNIPGAMAWLWPGPAPGSPSTTPPYPPYTWGPFTPGTTPPPPFPTGGPPTTGSLASPAIPIVATGTTEFASDWSSTLVSALSRLDLNRPLPNYPTPAATGPMAGQITDLTGFAIAQDARTQLAGDIFQRLWQVTGAGNPATVTPPTGPLYNNPQWNALRWLAQLSVNIVDYIDTDDYITPFPWYKNPSNPTDATQWQWVYGTELPRVVINEGYIEYTPGSTATKPVTFNVWAELYNPFSTDTTLLNSDNGTARLETGNPAYGIYQLLITKDPTASTPNSIPVFSQPGNVTGDPNFGGASNILNTGSGSLPGLTTWHPATGPALASLPAQIPPGAAASPSDPRYIYPSSGATSGPIGKNQGYYVVGPAALGSGASVLTPTLVSPQMTFQVTPTPQVPAPTTATIILRRLACPRLPYNNTVTSPLYNPYVTVDYMPNVTANKSSTAASGKMSYGRVQPYYGGPASLSAQTPPPPASTTQPKHTFFKVNNPPNPTTAIPSPWKYTWLVHLDRQLISPMELLHVSAYPAYNLTKQFGTAAQGGPLWHYAPWFSPQSRLYRVFEFLGTRSLAMGFSAPATTTKTAIGVAAGPAGNPTPPIQTTVTPAAMAGVTASGVPWMIKPPPTPTTNGDTLIVDTGVNQENVVVLSTTATTFTAKFRKSHAAGVPITLTTLVDRIPGKINLNTVWEDLNPLGTTGTRSAIFRGLCAPSASINLTDAQVDAIFKNLLDSRSPKNISTGPTADPMYTVGPTDASLVTPGYNVLNRPFRSLATGVTLGSANDILFPLSPPGPPGSPPLPSGVGIADTLFRPQVPVGSTSASSVPLLTILPSSPTVPLHPYQADQLLTKIFNNVTTRSNVFAVWVTVGFFEVVDDSVRPVRLGAEIGRAQSQNVRHQMFAIIDRSKLVAAQTTSLSGVTANPANPTPQSMTPASMAGIQIGSLITVELGTTRQESVIVTAVTAGPPASFTATFTQTHGANAPLIVYAPPGPMVYTPPTPPGSPTNTFNPHAHPAILHFSIIN